MITLGKKPLDAPGCYLLMATILIELLSSCSMPSMPAMRSYAILPMLHIFSKAWMLSSSLFSRNFGLRRRIFPSERLDRRWQKIPFWQYMHRYIFGHSLNKNGIICHALSLIELGWLDMGLPGSIGWKLIQDILVLEPFSSSPRPLNLRHCRTLVHTVAEFVQLLVQQIQTVIMDLFWGWVSVVHTLQTVLEVITYEVTKFVPKALMICTAIFSQKFHKK